MHFALYTAKRILLLIPLLIGLSFVTFCLLHVGGANPAVAAAGPTADAATIEAMEEQMHLDRPLLVQYGYYLRDAVHGDLGDSWLTKRSVATELRERLPITLELATVGMLFAMLVGVAGGFFSARQRGRVTDHVLRVLSLVGISVPIFWLALILIFLFFVQWDIAPAPLGRTDIGVAAPTMVTGAPLLDSLLTGNFAAARSLVGHMALPVLAMILVVGGTVMKQARAAIVEVQLSPAVRYARACGLSRWSVTKLILHNAAPSIITFSAIAYSLLISNAALVELVFSWGGLGQLGLDAVVKGDLWMVQGFVLALGIVTALVYFLADLLVARIDPRVSL